jgi:hypothetical protein
MKIIKNFKCFWRDWTESIINYYEVASAVLSGVASINGSRKPWVK